MNYFGVSVISVLSTILVLNVLMGAFNLTIIKRKHQVTKLINNIPNQAPAHENVISPSEENETGKYCVYLKMQNGSFEKCFHSFKTLNKAARYAKLGAINCKSITLVLVNGKEVYKADYRPN